MAGCRLGETQARSMSLLECGLFPAATLDAQGSLGPQRSQAVDGLEHVSPSALEQVVALQDQCDGDTLTCAEYAEGGFVGRDHFYLGADVRLNIGDGVGCETHRRGLRRRNFW